MTDEYRVQVTGLKELQKALRQFDDDLPKELKVRFLEIAGRVADIARANVPARSGRARASVKPHGTLKGASVWGGGARVPYYPWLDFGGGDPHRRGVTPNRLGGSAFRRPFIEGGRYIYPAVKDQRQETMDAAMDALREAVTDAGLGWEEFG